MNPLARLVQRLNQARPLVVMAHTSRLALLAAEVSDIACRPETGKARRFLPL
jgi:hypothetical protein